MTVAVVWPGVVPTDTRLIRMCRVSTDARLMKKRALTWAQLTLAANTAPVAS